MEHIPDDSNPFGILSNLKFSEDDYLRSEEVVEEVPQVNDNSHRRNIKIRVWLEKKKRAGKPVSVITGFDEDKGKLKELAKLLKTRLGVGGSFSEGEIIIQGQNRDKIIEILKSQGFNNIKKAGG
jgi:translation initiation factor 1